MKLKMAVLAFIFDLRHTWSAWMPTHGINKIWRSLRGRRAITSARTRVSRPVPRTWLKIYMLTWTPLDVPLLKPFTGTIISFHDPTPTLKTQSLNHKPQHNIKNRTKNMRRSRIFTFIQGDYFCYICPHVTKCGLHWFKAILCIWPYAMNHNLQSFPHFLVIWKKQSHFTQRAAILNNQTSHERKGRYAAKLSTILVKILAIEHHHAKTPASIDKHTQRSSDAQRNHYRLNLQT